MNRIAVFKGKSVCCIDKLTHISNDFSAIIYIVEVSFPLNESIVRSRFYTIDVVIIVDNTILELHLTICSKIVIPRSQSCTNRIVTQINRAVSYNSVVVPDKIVIIADFDKFICQLANCIDIEGVLINTGKRFCNAVGSAIVATKVYMIV